MRRLLSLFLTVLLFSACSQAPRIDSNSKTRLWLEYQIAASAIQSWNIKGRIAVKSDKQSGTVTLLWNQDPANYELRFVAPFSGTYILTGSADGVVMQGPKDKTLMAENAEQLLRQGLGWDVHLNGLRFWVRGLPEPDISYSDLILDDKGRLSNLEQSGFNVSISRYTEQSGISLPEKLSIKSDTIQLKVIIQNWEI